MTYGLLITTVGQAAIAADLGGGADLVLTHVAFGDASGTPYAPTEAQTALVNERYRSTIASVSVIAGAIVVDAIIPADTNDASARPSHGFNVAECGLFNAAGTMIGVARMSNGFKPSPASGQAAIATFRLKLAVANPSAISVVIDPQAQIVIGRNVRPFWVTVDGVLSNPPASPATGATYVIGTAPTGAWTGFAGRLAQWVGVWSLATVPEGHVVCDNSATIVSTSRYLRKEGAVWVSAAMTAAAAGFADPAFVRGQALNFVAAANVAGTANAVTLAFSPVFPSLAALVGTPLVFVAEAINSGAVTVAVDATAATALTWPDGTALVAGDIANGALIIARHDGTAYRMQQCLSPTQVRALIGTGASIPGRTQIFTASGTFTVPAGITQVEIEGWSAGGAGGASGDGVGNIAGTAGCGGGAGGYGYKRISGLTPGGTVAVTIGAGGAGVANAAVAAGNGGSTSFGSHMSCSGGNGGQSGRNYLLQGGAGGGVTGADLGISGGQGGTGGANSTFAAEYVLHVFNKGGLPGRPLGNSDAFGTGASGKGYGTGGNSASGGSAVAGGAGAPGILIVRW